jgi:hypothetical protein
MDPFLMTFRHQTREQSVNNNEKSFLVRKHVRVFVSSFALCIGGFYKLSECLQRLKLSQLLEILSPFAGTQCFVEYSFLTHKKRGRWHDAPDTCREREVADGDR